MAYSRFILAEADVIRGDADDPSLTSCDFCHAVACLTPEKQFYELCGEGIVTCGDCLAEID